MIVKSRGHSECVAGKHFVYGALCIQVLIRRYQSRSLDEHVQYVLLYRASVRPLTHSLSTSKVPQLPRPTLCASVFGPIDTHPRKFGTILANKIALASVILCP